MDKRFVFLTEKEEMWAKMLLDVLKDNEIPATSVAVNGVGFSIHTGLQDRLKIFVPEECFSRAKVLLQELFPPEEQGDADE